MARKFNFILAFGLLHMTCLSLGYEFVCPDVSQWRFRARSVCTSDYSMYHCLYDTNRQNFVERCNPAVEYTTGRKAILSGNLNAQICGDTRYMPFILVSNISADCVYQKSVCSEEGQIVHHVGSSAEDTACMCDFTAGYAFVVNPKNRCYCVPSEEDCSCYRKLCLNEYQLSSDYNCILKTDPFYGAFCSITLITNRQPTDGSGLQSKSEELNQENIEKHLELDLFKWFALFATIALSAVGVLFLDTDANTFEEGIVYKEEENIFDNDIENAININVKSAICKCFFAGNAKGDGKKRRILDMCFVNVNKNVSLLYIDADNNCIVTRSVSDNTDEYVTSLLKNPSRISKINEEEIAVIYKKHIDIEIYNVKDKQTKAAYSVDLSRFYSKEKYTHVYGIQGIVALNRTEFILSNQHMLYHYYTKSDTPVTQFSEEEFDTARRLAVSPNKKIVFVADENEKQITSFHTKNGLKISQQCHHNRGLQNVRAIVATKNKVYAATAEGVAVFSHDNGNFVNGNSYKMLLEYRLNVGHTRSLCLEEIGDRIYLGLSFVKKGQDIVAVYSFLPDNDFC